MISAAERSIGPTEVKGRPCVVGIVTRSLLRRVGELVLLIAVVFLPLNRPIAAECDSAREIPAPALNEIAIASADQYGFVIFYEPDLLARIGPSLSTFFLKHEYAHVCLGHVRHEMVTVDPYNRSWLSDAQELQADCLAAKTLQAQGNTKAILAAIEYFTGDSATRFVPGHPTHIRRANNIQECAAQ